VVILLIIIGIAILILNIWNLISLKQLENNSTSTNNQLNDSKYYELKFKSEFIIAVFSIVAAVGGLLGYNTITSAEENIKKDFLSKTTFIDSLITQTEERILEKDSILEKIENRQDLINKTIPENDAKLHSQENQIDLIQKTLTELNQNNKVKQSFYLIQSLEIKKDMRGMPENKTFYFKDLKTNIGDVLPTFNKLPFLIPLQENIGIDIFDITLESFSVSVSTYLVLEGNDRPEPEKFEFGIMLIENK